MDYSYGGVYLFREGNYVNFQKALVSICAVSMLTGLGYGFIGTGRYMNSVRLLSAMWIISILLETAVCCVGVGN